MTLLSIESARKKLESQYSDYDHLSVELKTKLDDKEATVGEINASFRVLKKNVLEGAEDSRTGQVRKFCVCV